MCSFNHLKKQLIFILLILTPFLIHSQVQSEYKKIIINSILLEGNKQTKKDIILRELVFKPGDEIILSEFSEKISRSRENLLNTSLFNFVTINYLTDSNKLDVYIEMQERWYVWPYPVLEHADRNFSSFLKNQEWSRIDYGLFMLINNFRGRKEILKLKTIFGYNNEFNIYYYNPYINKNQTIGTGVDVRYIRNHEVPYTIYNDELKYLKLTDQHAREKLQISNFFTFRPQLNTHHLINIKYSNINIEDSVLLLNGNYFFDKNSKMDFFTLGYIYNYDNRDSKIYPLKGFRFHFAIHRNGFGILTSNGNFNIKTIIEENYPFTKRFFINTSLEGQVNLNDKSSFYFSEAIGYDNYLRGMEYYVSNGSIFYISKTNLKLEIIPQKNFNIKFIRSDKFGKVHFALYSNIFFDTGYVDSDYTQYNSITNEFLYSGGIGIDLVTYYDKVLRIEYSLNKFGEHGIFFHLGAPIIED